MFCVDNSSSFHTDNRKNNFLALAEGNTLGIMEASVHERKSLVLILVKQIQKFAWVCIIMAIIVIFFFVNGNEINMLKADNKNASFPNQFYSRKHIF